jgi:Flp pilus assembly protein TadD
MATLATPSGQAASDVRAGRLIQARTALEGMLAQNPDGLSALNDLAVTYAAEQRFDAARALFEEVLTRGGPQDQQAALVNLAELYALDGYLAAAEAHLASARATDPSRPEPSYALALLADARGDRATAISALGAALEYDRTGAARRALAFLYPEERLHLDALVAEAVGDAPTADARWRELARGRFRTLAQAAQRHLE